MTVPATGESTQDSTAALYLRHRPRTFAGLIGQQHVTASLSNALRKGAIHHAYLFSGDRGCGKTSSARILAASLNCEQGPTPDPCGQCSHCVAIEKGLHPDVQEIDAASQGGVDDARNMREKSYFTPMSARFKVYIVDEAHMVSPAGFNALLKIVEEPPPHVKFIFATTEPDRVLATIRSRSFHYQFRLVDPEVLSAHLAGIVAAEGVGVEDGVLPLVIRCGGGSVRDSLALLDQLIKGSAGATVTLQEATGLLGTTDSETLDRLIEALVGRDVAVVMTALDAALTGGVDAKVLASDVLERVRELFMLVHVPTAVEAGLLPLVSPVQVAARKELAARFAAGGGQAARYAAAQLQEALSLMRSGGEARLALEVAVANICSLRPAPAPVLDVEAIAAAVAARLGTPRAGATPSAAAPVAAAPVPAPREQPGTNAAAPASAAEQDWSTVVEQLTARSRASGALVAQYGKLAGLDRASARLSLQFATEGLVAAFDRGGNRQLLQDTLSSVLGGDWTVDIATGGTQ